MLSEMLIEAVANGGSVSFMHPLQPETAYAFWEDSLAAAARDRGGSFSVPRGALLVGAVTLLLDLPPNRPLRAEIARMMTRVGHRHRGIATALMRAAEKLAIERGRTLLVRDTAAEYGGSSLDASSLYKGLITAWASISIIPDYALRPPCFPTGTIRSGLAPPQAQSLFCG